MRQGTYRARGTGPARGEAARTSFPTSCTSGMVLQTQGTTRRVLRSTWGHTHPPPRAHPEGLCEPKSSHTRTATGIAGPSGGQRAAAAPPATCRPTPSVSLPAPQGEAPGRVPGAEGEHPGAPGRVRLPPPLPQVPATVRDHRDGGGWLLPAARPRLTSPLRAATPSSPPRRGRRGAGTSGKGCSTCCAPSTWTQTSTRWGGARCSSRTLNR